MVVRLLFICSLSPKLSCETVRARGATLDNLSVYSYYSVQYWCGGAALLAKLWSCGSECAGFAMCAARVGLTFGLDMPQIVQIRSYMERIEVAGARILNAEARILLAEAPILKQVRRFPNRPFQ